MTDLDNILSEQEKRLLLSVAVKIAMRLIFHHHFYSFKGQVYIQAQGGPIGLWFTSVVAIIVMDHWMGVFLTSLVDAGVTIHTAMKYVDDMNLIMALLKLSSRWVGTTLECGRWRTGLQAGLRMR